MSVKPGVPLEELSDYYFLMYAKPDEATYNYVLIPLWKRWNGQRREWKDVPANVIKRVVKEADPSYPILIFDGWVLDSMFDKIACNETNFDIFLVEKAWNYPRRVREPFFDTDSTAEFEKDLSPEEAKQRENLRMIKEASDALLRAKRHHMDAQKQANETKIILGLAQKRFDTMKEEKR